MITYTKRKFRILLALMIVNLIFIWGNSLLTGDVSAQISKWIREILSIVFEGGNDLTGKGHGVLRKLAHFVEFCSLGLLLTWLFALGKKAVAQPFICGFLVACTDESIQCFVPDRGPSVADVALDTLGVCIGVALFYLLLTIYKKQNKVSMEDNKQ